MLSLQFMVAFAQFNKMAFTFESSPTQVNLEMLSNAIHMVLSYCESGLSIEQRYVESVAETITGKLYGLIGDPNIGIMYTAELLDLIIATGEARQSNG